MLSTLSAPPLRFLATESRKRHVVLVSEPGRDGAFTHVDGLARWLLRQGHLVDLAYSSFRSCPALFELIGTIERAGGETIDLRVSSTPSPRDLLAYARLRSFIARRHPDIAHAHSSKAGAYLRLLPDSLVPSRLYTPHAYYGLRPGRSLGGGFFNRIERLLGSAAFTINVSESEAGFAETVLRIPARLRCTVPNGVDMARFSPPSPEQRRAARQQLGLPLDARILLSISRLCYQKDPHTLYTAFHAAAAREPSLRLLHLCAGPDLGYANEALNGPHRDRIHRFHEQQNPLAFYHAADGFILSSRYEGLPLVVLEAMSCGLPLILSAVSGNDDILNHRPSTAWWFVSQDHHRAASCIEEWLSHGPVTNNHRELVRQHYSCEISHRRIEQLYLEMAGVTT